jgi:NitT/TauT family transport system substrate-binding protein
MEKMVKKQFPILLGSITIVFLLILFFTSITNFKTEPKLGLAIEFNTHAAPAYIALESGWYSDEGIELNSFESYVTGVALASALSRGDVQVAYICAGPAIVAKARGVPIKIVSATHKYGYSIIAKPEIEDVLDLKERKIGCVSEGSQTDLFLQYTIRKFNITDIEIRRMNPPKLIIALITGQIDVAFLPEHYATLAESYGFNCIATSQEIWPNMLGSVLIVQEDLIDNNPELVKKLVEINDRGIAFIKKSPNDASILVASQLKISNPLGVDESIISPQIAKLDHYIVKKSMGNIDYTNHINEKDIQEYIDFLRVLGYVENDLKPEDLIDMRFIN